MNNNNKFIYFYGVQVEKTKGGNFKVILEEEEATIYISSNDVNRIQRKVDEIEEIIAIVLAYVEYVFQNNKKLYETAERLDQDVINDNVIVILSQMSAEEMIDIIKSLKWHEVIQIFEAENQVQKIRDFK